MAFELDHRLKGYPIVADATTIDHIGARQWHVLDDAMPYPLATLRASALMHNLAWMQAWAQRKGVQLAPHGKTTMSPQLYQLQLSAGAWAISFATVYQAGIGVAHGVRRVLIANQVLQAADLDGLAHLLATTPGLEAMFLVDSIAQIEQIEHWRASRSSAIVFAVLLELGLAGGRTGCRTHEQALALARLAHASRAVRLAGIECYEGLAATGDDAQDRERTHALMDRVEAIARACDGEGLFDTEEVIVSAGGSAVFDLVAPRLRPALALYFALGVALVTVFLRYQVLDPPAPGAESTCRWPCASRTTRWQKARPRP